MSIHREPAPGAESTQSGNKCDLGEHRALGGECKHRALPTSTGWRVTLRGDGVTLGNVHWGDQIKLGLSLLVTLILFESYCTNILRAV